MGAAAETLDALRTAVARIEASGSDAHARPRRIALGIAAADAALGGGLRRGALHAVTAASLAGAAAATGFAAALAALAAAKGRWALWIRQDMAALENGEIWGPGMAEIGLDPGRLIVLRAPDFAAALKAAEAGLASPALAAVVVEPFGATPGFDLVAGRRLALAAGRSGALGLMLRTSGSATPLPAGLLAAETRWRIAPLASPRPDAMDFASAQGASAQDCFRDGAWGRPLARAELVRNRLGSLGDWPLAWGYDDGAFRLAERGLPRRPAARPDAGAVVAADSGARAAQSADRQGQAAGGSPGRLRRAG